MSDDTPAVKRGRPRGPHRPVVPAFRDQESVVDALNRKAFRERKSVADVVREALRKYLGLPGMNFR